VTTLLQPRRPRALCHRRQSRCCPFANDSRQYHQCSREEFVAAKSGNGRPLTILSLSFALLHVVARKANLMPDSRFAIPVARSKRGNAMKTRLEKLLPRVRLDSLDLRSSSHLPQGNAALRSETAEGRKQPWLKGALSGIKWPAHLNRRPVFYAATDGELGSGRSIRAATTRQARVFACFARAAQIMDGFVARCRATWHGACLRE